MFKTKEEMYKFIEENAGYIFNNPQKYLKLADSESELNPLHYAIGFIQGVVNASGFDLEEVEEDLQHYNVELNLVNWKE